MTVIGDQVVNLALSTSASSTAASVKTPHAERELDPGRTERTPARAVSRHARPVGNRTCPRAEITSPTTR